MTALSQTLEARGELEGKREALRIFVQTRFGVLPETVERRIDAATAEQLDDLINRAATVEQLDAF